MDMELSSNMRSELMSKVTTAVLLILASFCFVGGFFGTWFAVNGSPLDVAAYGGVLVLICASILVFFRPQWGYGLGTFGGLIALALLVWTESSIGESSWIFLNA